MATIDEHDGWNGPARRLASRTWPEVGRPLVLVPVGSTEQHGPHLPLDVDATIAGLVATEAAAQLASDGVDAVVAPPIAYGASGEHQAFPGTISIGTPALTLLLLEYGRSASEWAGRVVFVNGHGGNLAALAAAVPVLRSEQRDAAWLPCTPSGGRLSATDVDEFDAHAGHVETSILLARDPAAVRFERLERGNVAPLAELMPTLREGGLRDLAPTGVLGDPRRASAEVGERILGAMVGDALARLRAGASAGAGGGTGLGAGTVDGRGCLVAPRDPDAAEGRAPATSASPAARPEAPA